MHAPWGRAPVRLLVPGTGLSSRLSPSTTSPSVPLSSPLSLLPLRHRPRTPPPPPPPSSLTQTRPSSASSRWKLRQGADPFARSARVQGLKSRAAFKLLELDAKYHLFRRGRGQVVVDLGYAPGSWSQVAVDRTAPGGTVVGIDIIPAQPPKGVSTIQGNFLSPGVQGLVKQFLVEGEKKRRVERRTARRRERGGEEEGVVAEEGEERVDEIAERPSYIDLERMAAHESEAESGSEAASSSTDEGGPKEEQERPNLRLVDVRPRSTPLLFPASYPASSHPTRTAQARVANTTDHFHNPPGSPQRHVSTLAPDPRLLGQQFE